MARLIVYFAHPGHNYSHVNRYMAQAARKVDDITFVVLVRGLESARDSEQN